MALGTTHITTDLVGTRLGTNIRTVGGLCTFNDINRWSYYKPVSGTWPFDSDTNTWFGINPFNGWTYTQPSSNYRLGDFRGYEHFAQAPYAVDDEDHSIYAPDIYPYGTGTDHFDVYFHVHNTPVSGSVSISDLGLSNYYLCFKVVVGADTYYKTYNKLSSYTDYAQISIAPSLVTPVSAPYTFTNYPYYVGSTTIYFGFSNVTTNGWTLTSNLPSGFLFYLTPDESKQSYPAIINHYTFTIHDWIYLDDTSMSFTGNNYTYQSSHIDTSLTTWVLMSKPSWVDVDVYESGSHITNSSLWSTDMDIHVIPNSDNTTGSTRTGTVDLGDGTNVLATIGIGQDVAQNPPAVIVSTGGFDASSSSGSVAPGSTALSYSLTPTNVGLNVLCNVVLFKNSIQIDTDTIILKDNTQYDGSFTLATAADYNDDYLVQITKP